MGRSQVFWEEVYVIHFRYVSFSRDVWHNDFILLSNNVGISCDSKCFGNYRCC